MPCDLKARLDQFATDFGYDKWELEDDGEDGLESTFFRNGEPFGFREYLSGSDIRTRWEALQEEVDDLEPWQLAGVVQ